MKIHCPECNRTEFYMKRRVVYDVPVELDFTKGVLCEREVGPGDMEILGASTYTCSKCQTVSLLDGNKLVPADQFKTAMIGVHISGEASLTVRILERSLDAEDLVARLKRGELSLPLHEGGEILEFGEVCVADVLAIDGIKASGFRLNPEKETT